MPENLASIGMDDAVDDFHQGAFAGTVFAEQRVDFTGGDSQVDGIVGQAAGVAFTDVAQLQTGRWIGGGHDRLDSIELMPVDKAIFWPSGQEIFWESVCQGIALAAVLGLIAKQAPLECNTVDPLPFCASAFDQKMST
jgi:hypothetical protein